VGSVIVPTVESSVYPRRNSMNARHAYDTQVFPVMAYSVRQSLTDPDEWIVWGPMGNPEFVGKHSGHPSSSAAYDEALRLHGLRRPVRHHIDTDEA
jgi:hypothetical protein